MCFNKPPVDPPERNHRVPHSRGEMSLRRFYWKSRYSIFITVTGMTFGLAFLFGFCLVVNGTMTDRRTAYAITGSITVLFLVSLIIVTAVLRYRKQFLSMPSGSNQWNYAQAGADSPILVSTSLAPFVPATTPVQSPISDSSMAMSFSRSPRIILLPSAVSDARRQSDAPPSYEHAISGGDPPPYGSCV